ncbi:acyl-CoA thioesterase [uncultured Tateyamaria sp.]|uniref:acyl-CoA thioesterase n=1 Tax=uncultured Tateyamaria sp. TaxID=455651 RepID=UPI00261DCEA2|nr:acyl-CoA thioesterase [uncultured Tateyamaria sp.]
MFPFIRLVKDMLIASRQPALGLTDMHVSRHRVWPWDLDGILELNNGRALTLYDLGRLGMGLRAGLMGTLRAQRWGLTMAGSSVRYRRRLHAFERFEMRSRAVCWDDKFVYIEQSMWQTNGECASHVLYRAAVTDQNGIVPPDRVLREMGQTATSPETPDWIAAWIKAEAQRPWPPMQDEAPAPILKSVA